MERESLFRHMAAKIVIKSDFRNKISVKFSLQNILRHLQRIYIVAKWRMEWFGIVHNPKCHRSSQSSGIQLHNSLKNHLNREIS